MNTAQVSKRLKVAEAESDQDEDQLFFISNVPDDINQIKANADVVVKADQSIENSNEDKEVKPQLQRKFENRERNLEKFLFGKSVSKTVKSEKPIQDGSEDDASSDSSSEDESDIDEQEELKVDKKSLKRKPVWHDEDDDKVLVKDVTAKYTKAKGKHGLKETSTENYAQSLRTKFSSLVDTPKWADLDRTREKDEDSDDEFFRETTDMLERGKQESLKKGILEYRKLKDINFQTHNEGAVIRSCEFHPSATVGLVAGLNGAASLFQIDGKMNPKMQTVNFENFPIRTAHFTTDGHKFMVGSKHFGHFYIYDMYAGKIVKVPWKEDREQTTMQRFEVSPANDLIAFHGRFGNIHLLSAKSFTKIFSLKMNDNVESLAFSPDGERLYSHGAGGEVYVWDLKSQDCLHRFWDDGCIKGTAIHVSPNNRFVATGSDSGVVNIYRRSELMTSTRPKPEKIVLNLTSSIANVKFNPTSEILAMSSEIQDNAIKLLHLPSMTVFTNFPGFNFNLKRINCFDFSLNGGYLGIGNNRGAANLYRLKHFGSF